MESECSLVFSDEELVRRIRATGDRSAQESVYRKYLSSVRNRCRSIVHDVQLAEDIAQDTFTRAFQSIESFRGGNFSPWLHAIARNLSLNLLRNRARIVFSPDQSGQTGAEGKSFDPHLRLLAEELLDTVSRKQRSCLTLHYFQDFTYLEIAKLTGESLGQVKSHIKNGIARLKRAQAQAASQNHLSDRQNAMRTS